MAWNNLGMLNIFLNNLVDIIQSGNRNAQLQLLDGAVYVVKTRNFS